MAFSFTSPLTGVKVSLSDQKTWGEFHPDTEMIVTKTKGRVIFPHLDYKIEGLDEVTLYEIGIHLERVDNIKVTFNNGRWEEAGKGDEILPIQYKEHKDGARLGAYWMKDIVSFSNIKITNDKKNTDNDSILVQSMHKFVPVITIKIVRDNQRDNQVEEFRLSGTEFVVVTAYQNRRINDLKTNYNKFAAGHRPNGKHKNRSDSENTPPSGSKRCRSTSSSSNTSTPPTVFPMNWSQPLNPVVFNQNGSPPAPFPSNSNTIQPSAVFPINWNPLNPLVSNQSGSTPAPFPSNSSTPAPPTVFPMNYNPLNPVVFNQNGSPPAPFPSNSNTPTPPTVSPPVWNPLNPTIPGAYPMAPYQHFDFTAAGANQIYWNRQYQAQMLNWSQMNMNMNMNSWNAQATDTTNLDTTNDFNYSQL